MGFLNLCVIFLLFLITSAAASATSAAAHANSSFLHLSPGRNFTMSASFDDNGHPISLDRMFTVATPTLEEEGLFFPILSSPSFTPSDNSPFGFSLGFYFLPSPLIIADATFDPCNSVSGCLPTWDIYMAVCAGSLGNFTLELSGSDVLLYNSSKNASRDLTPKITVDGIAAPVWIANLDRPIRYADEASLMVVADSKGGSELQLRDGENVVWQFPNVDIMEMQNSGHLRFHSSSNTSHPVWQSSPTDSLVQGQTLTVGEQLVSNGSSYVARMEKGGLVFYMNKTRFNGELQPPPYWLFPLYSDYFGPRSLNQLISSAPCSNSALAYAEVQDSSFALYPCRSNKLHFELSRIPPTGQDPSWNFWRLESDGMFYTYAVSSPTSNGSATSVKRNPLSEIIIYELNTGVGLDPLFLHWQECNVPMACGPLGVCTPGAKTSCSCLRPDYFQPINETAISQGCRRLIGLPNCTFGKSHTGSTDFVRFKSTASILLFNEWTFNSTPGVQVNACKQSCSSDCSCNGFFYQINKSSCFFITDEITLLTVADTNYTSLLDLNFTALQDPAAAAAWQSKVFARDYVTYLKVASVNKLTSSERPKGSDSELPTEKKGKIISTPALVALSALIPFAVLGMAGYLYREWRKKHLHTSMPVWELSLSLESSSK